MGSDEGYCHEDVPCQVPVRNGHLLPDVDVDRVTLGPKGQRVHLPPHPCARPGRRSQVRRVNLCKFGSLFFFVFVLFIFFVEGGGRLILKGGVKTYLIAPMSPLNLQTCFLSSHL